MTVSFQARRWIRTFFVLSLVLCSYVLMQGVVTAQVPADSFGIGSGQGLETGINIDALNRVRADINAGMYDRACTAAEHNPTKWHSLVNLTAKCHYDHQHNDDPDYVDDIFGEPGAWFGAPGQSLSYPWQTFKATTATEQNAAFVANHTMENDLKHEGYVWVVRRGQACPSGACVTDFRLLVHALMGAADMPVRYHSFSLEARVCMNASDPSSCGIVRYGGWADMGRLFTTAPDQLDCSHSANEIFIPLPADTQFFPIERPASRDEIRCHPTITRLPATTGGKPLAEWWGHAGGETRFQLRSYDPIGNVDPNDPTKWHFHCTPGDVNCKFDASIFSAFIGYTLQIPEFVGQSNLRSDQNRDGRTDFRGYFTRWGDLNPTCTAAALDCVPYQYDNVILNFFNNQEARYAQTICDNCARTDYNISPPGKDWITWFFTKYGTGISPTPVPPPNSTPVPPPTTNPSVIVSVNTPNANPGDNVEVAINVANLKDLYGLQTVCTVDQNILIGMSHADGTIFKNGNSFFVDSGFNAGKWTVAASLLQPNPAFTGGAMAYKLNYKVQNAGSSSVTCTALAVDKNGKEIPATVINGSFNGGVVQPPATEPPPVVFTEVPPPTVVPPATLPPPSSALSTISGVAVYQNHPDNSGITVQLVTSTDVLATVTTNADGKFTFTDVPQGSYGITAVAPEHLRIGKLVSVTVDGQAIDAGKLTLPAGDTDDSGKIDLLDASLVGANFNSIVPPSPLNADLNNDNKVDIRDLALIGSNFGMTGPVVVQ